MDVKRLIRGAIIASLYALITLAVAPISSGLMQVRLSEGLCVLPFFAPEAVLGLFIGCLAANLLTGAMWLDVVFGSLATLIAAALTRLVRLRGWNKALAPLPAVAVNALIVGAVLCYGYEVGPSFWVCAAYVAAGQGIACYGIGLPLMAALTKVQDNLFG